MRDLVDTLPAEFHTPSLRSLPGDLNALVVAGIQKKFRLVPEGGTSHALKESAGFGRKQKFFVGDTVRVSYISTHSSQVLRGKIGTVTSYERYVPGPIGRQCSGYYHLDIEADHAVGSGLWEDELELVAQRRRITEYNPEFKVGDRVQTHRVRANTSGFGDDGVGHITKDLGDESDYTREHLGRFKVWAGRREGDGMYIGMFNSSELERA